jgi:Protein of function (DUF2518)
LVFVFWLSFGYLFATCHNSLCSIMFTTADFFNYGRIVGWATIGFGALAVLAFLFKWGFRFRLVGVTGFLGVLTSGLFALSFVPITHAQIPGAAHYSLVYDNGGTGIVITVAANITPNELEATLQQAASDLFSPGRLGQSATPQTNAELQIRARTVVHPQDNVSQLLVLGEARRSLALRDEPQLEVKIFAENFKQLPA